MMSLSKLPDCLRSLSAQDYLKLNSWDKLKLVTLLKQENWQEIHQFAATLVPET